ncbi:hypothetical protein [Tenacibaculum dicentrarchi]|uniref:hypothetical protein n=1 Tax=Tenacibaculum dicentrarchi TaxID=669041 RepID=UPI0035111F67
MTATEKNDLEKELRKEFDKELKRKISDERCKVFFLTLVSVAFAKIIMTYIIPYKF